MAFQQGQHLPKARHLRERMNRLMAEWINRVGIGAMRKQPFGAREMVQTSRAAEQEIERADLQIPARPTGGRVAPFMRGAAGLATPPKQLVPTRVAGDASDIVQGLEIERIGAGRDEQVNE
jgi:hypothetical protein